MTDTRGQAVRKLFPLFLAVLAGVLLAQLGGRIMVGGGEKKPDMPRIPRFTGDVDRDSRQNVVQFARALPWVATFGAGDEQRLLVIEDGNRRYGPKARIEPLLVAHTLDRKDLAEGRFVGRIINNDDEPYSKLGLGARDTTYWWVDSAATGKWRAVFFSSDPAIQTVSMPVNVEPSSPDGSHRWTQSTARWIWLDQDEKTWVSCGYTFCCRTD